MKALGFDQILPQKNPHMISFKKEEGHHRVNIYNTTMTVTVQDLSKWGSINTFRRVTLSDLEEIVTNETA